jgi:ATP-binding cassette, subfamily B, bacterial
MADYWRAIRLLVRTAWRVDRWRTLGALLEPLGNVLGLLAGLWLAVLTTAVAHRDVSMALVSITGISLGIGLGWQLDISASQWRLVLGEKVGLYFDAEIAELCSTLPGLEHHESPEFRDKLELLRRGQGALGSSLGSLAMALKAVCGGLTVFVLLAAIHPWMLLLMVLALPTVQLTRTQRRWQQQAEEASAVSGRLGRHLRSLAYDRDAGMEIRVFGLAGEMADRAERAWADSRRPLDAARLRVAVMNAVRDTVWALGVIASIGLISWRVLQGRAPVGDIVLAVYLSQQVQTAVLWPVTSIGGLGQTLRTAGRMIWLREYAARAMRGRGSLPAPSRILEGITFEDVSFRYPGSQTWVLRHVSLTIPAGSVLAVIGENGAGKTTLVKLLSRMYEPTEGRILVDGMELAAIETGAWRQRLAAAFQDFARFEFTAQHSVGVGDLPRLDDSTAVDSALERAGAAYVIQALPDGAATQLGVNWDGVDLSGGQWQMLALGRALMRLDPVLLFLDEPTAALDPTTEHALFERYSDAMTAGGAAGMITVLVSHRFSTVRGADHIIVLSEQGIAEQGNHAQLMAAGGRYCHLYKMQAESYRIAT